MISALARSPWNGSTDVITTRLSVITPPATEPLTIAEAKSQVRLDSSAGEPLPSTAVVIALAGLGAGACDNGVHRVACSFVTAAGETPPGPLSAPITVVDKTVNGQLTVTGIPAGSPAVTLVKLWMPPVGALTPLLYAGSVANGVATATITLADAGLGAGAPTLNTAVDTSDLALWITAARSLCESEPAGLTSGGTGRALITQTLALTLDGFPSGWNPLAGNANTGGYYRERSYLGGSGLRPILLPRPPLVSVSSITYVDQDGVAQTWSPSLYTVEKPTGDYADPGRIFPNFGEIYPIARAMPGAVTITFVAGYGLAAAVPAPLKAGMKLLIGLWWLNREAGQIIRGSADILPFGVDALWQPFRVL